MCGRYNLIHDPAVWRLTRPIKVGKTAPFQPRYNIAPEQPVPVYREHGDGLELQRRCLIPTTGYYEWQAHQASLARNKNIQIPALCTNNPAGAPKIRIRAEHGSP